MRKAWECIGARLPILHRKRMLIVGPCRWCQPPPEPEHRVVGQGLEKHGAPAWREEPPDFHQRPRNV
jgi:hypothetical protein